MIKLNLKKKCLKNENFQKQKKVTNKKQQILYI